MERVFCWFEMLPEKLEGGDDENYQEEDNSRKKHREERIYRSSLEYIKAEVAQKRDEDLQQMSN